MPIKLNFGSKTPAVVSDGGEEGQEPVGGGKILPSSRDGDSSNKKQEKGSAGSLFARNLPGVQWQNLEKAMGELDQLIGLTEAKRLIREAVAFTEIQRVRARENLLSESLSLHMIFKGHPGTGKTTVARIAGKVFKELGVLSKGHLIEVERADLVGEYIGHTARKTREHLKRALGGILFIDEAYSLARGGERDFGREAIDCLVKGMEDHREEFILILAGYRDEMELFIRSNPGLRSRFPIILDFPDYSLEELINIARLMLSQKQYRLTVDAEVKLEKMLRKSIFSGYNRSGNARLARNIIENAIRRQAYRLLERGMELHRDNLLQITEEDLVEVDRAVLFSDPMDQERKVY
ncbi:MAG TPA: AAA family ATPase [Clostridia bacterium]|nr:AAA family ATPase [Clostridia bacterium]